MKRIIMVLCLFLGVVVLHAQLINLANNIQQSAITPQNELLLRIYSVDELSVVSFEAFTMRGGMVNTATFAPVNLSEQKAIITAPDNTLSQVGFRVESEYINMVIPWEVSTAQAAQAQYYIRAGTSPAGVVYGTSDNNIDLRGQAFSLSPTSINVMLQNEAAAYPSSMTQLYIYGSMMINADKFADLEIDLENFDPQNIDPAILAQLNAYSLIHSAINIPGGLSFASGIYKFPLSLLTSPETIDIRTILSLSSIGSVTSSTNSGALLIRANFSAFTSDPDFGRWPNYSNCLVAIPYIIKLTIPSFTFAIDVSPPTVVYCSPYDVLPQSNTSINLTLGSMTPLLYEVQYTSPGGFYPYFARFVNETQGVIEGMSTGFDFSQTNTFVFASQSPLGDGVFEFSTDNVNIERLPYIAGGCNDQTCVPVSGLIGNYPNPFNPSTTIAFALFRTGHVSIDIYNVRGQRVKTLVDGTLDAGEHSVVWDGCDAFGHNAVSGIYFYRMVSEEGVTVKKMVMVK